MKNFIYIIVLSFLMGGCVTEETDYYPKKTAYANHLYTNVRQSICESVAYMDMARKVDAWMNAETESEKIQIEDFYFPYCKIRQKGDTVSLVFPADYQSVKLITGGKGIEADDAVWNIYFYSGGIRISGKDRMKWRIENIDEVMTPDFPLFDIDIEQAPFSSSGSDYLVSGSGRGLSIGCKTHSADYIIDQVVKANVISERVNYLINTSQVALTSGSIEFNQVNIEDDKGSVAIFNKDEYGITFKGITETWTQYYYK